MPIDRKRLIEIIMEESVKVDERHEGYRESMMSLVSDILADERDHAVAQTNIQQRISDKCKAEAEILFKERG